MEMLAIDAAIVIAGGLLGIIAIFLFGWLLMWSLVGIIATAALAIIGVLSPFEWMGRKLPRFQKTAPRLEREIARRRALGYDH